MKQDLVQDLIGAKLRPGVKNLDDRSRDRHELPHMDIFSLQLTQVFE